MGDWTFCCWSCQTKRPMQARVRRTESCPHCLCDMHACKNCQFFDAMAHNQCREPVADWVPDKERSNFCDMFEASSQVRSGAPEQHEARAKLEALFHK